MSDKTAANLAGFVRFLGRQGYKVVHYESEPCPAGECGGWYEFGEPELIIVVTDYLRELASERAAARQARFEHGETPR